jgi:hypothetical protein
MMDDSKQNKRYRKAFAWCDSERHVIPDVLRTVVVEALPE